MGQGLIEILTVEEFAERMKVSRTTVFVWIKKGLLKAGLHYIKIGRTVRFQWGPDLVNNLHEGASEIAGQHNLNHKEKGLNRGRPKAKRGPAINIGY